MQSHGKSSGMSFVEGHLDIDCWIVNNILLRLCIRSFSSVGSARDGSRTAVAVF